MRPADGRYVRRPVRRRGDPERRRRERQSRAKGRQSRGHRGDAGRHSGAPVSQQRRAPPVPVLVDETGPDHRARHCSQQRQVQVRSPHRHALHQGRYTL